MLAALAVLLTTGCGGRNVTSVRGNVTYDAKPVTSGLVNFMPQGGGRPLGGGIEADGTYSFELPPGEYQVRIDAPAPLPPDYKEGQPMPELPRLVPEKYANYHTSGLSATVEPSGSQTIDFNLP